MATIWPGISLLLCMYHIWQAWRAGLTWSPAGVPQACRPTLHRSLAHFCMKLLKDITLFPDAVAALRMRSKLMETWQQAHFSLINRRLRTTHNNHIKTNYFTHHQHGGHLPRVDIWVLGLVLEVIPDFFFRIDNARAIEQQHAYLCTAPEACGAAPPSGTAASHSDHVVPSADLLKIASEFKNKLLEDMSRDFKELEPASPPIEESSLDTGSDLTDNLWLDMADWALNSTEILSDLSLTQLPALNSSSISSSPASPQSPSTSLPLLSLFTTIP
ncbi:hypothetical protein C8Q80DRAFT_1116605 [Daedaleopsis nitida]|nr:hypothetical protein C8Q80DRAFT_1116605 [Daedaleopsis nitida]